MITITQSVYFFFDDSGVLSQHEKIKTFVYAGYVFLSSEEKEVAKRKYINANRKIKPQYPDLEELKACSLKPKHKRALLNSVEEYDSVSAIVNISRLYSHVLNDKKSICRYKDYVLKRIVKRKLELLIADGRIKCNQDIYIQVNVDEQLTATNGYYDLRSSIFEELRHGIANWDYGVVHPNVFDKDVLVDLRYCESKKNYLIQASDILANRIWASYATGNEKLREIGNHVRLTFP
ncbi:MAG: DUF3800 domain-containing protein [Acutalibacter sp.]